MSEAMSERGNTCVRGGVRGTTGEVINKSTND